MKQIKMLTYILDFFLSNKYLKAIKNCLEPIIFNAKGDVSFIFLPNKTSTFSLNILGYRHVMITFQYLFDRRKSRL